MTTQTIERARLDEPVALAPDAGWASATIGAGARRATACTHRSPVIHLVLDGSVSAAGHSAAGRIAARLGNAAVAYVRHEDVPDGWRDEVAVAVAAMSAVVPDCVACGRDRVPLVAVWHFDPHGPQDRPPTPLAGGRIDDVVSGIAPPAGGTCSVLTYALTAVERHIAADADRPTVVAVLSDFELFDTHQAGEYERLAALPASVHAIALGGEAPAQLLRDARVTVTEVDARSGHGVVTAALLAAAADTEEAA